MFDFGVPEAGVVTNAGREGFSNGNTNGAGINEDELNFREQVLGQNNVAVDPFGAANVGNRTDLEDIEDNERGQASREKYNRRKELIAKRKSDGKMKEVKMFNRDDENDFDNIRNNEQDLTSQGF